MVARLNSAFPETQTGNYNQCLKYDQTILRNFPVSDADHDGIELLLTREGTLLVAVEGYTNVGVADGKLDGR